MRPCARPREQEVPALYPRQGRLRGECETQQYRSRIAVTSFANRLGSQVIDGGMKDKWGVLWNALRNYAHQLRTVDDTEDDRVRDAREAYDTALADFQTVLPRWKHQANARVGNNTPSKRQRAGTGAPAGLATSTMMLEEMQRQTQAQTAIAMGIRSVSDPPA